MIEQSPIPHLLFDPETTPRKDCPSCLGDVTLCREHHRQKAVKQNLLFVERQPDGSWHTEYTARLNLLDKIRLDLWRIANPAQPNNDNKLQIKKAAEYLRIITAHVVDVKDIVVNEGNIEGAVLDFNFNPKDPEQIDLAIQCQAAFDFWVEHNSSYLDRSITNKPIIKEQTTPMMKQGILFPNNINPIHNLALVRQFADRYTAAIKLVPDEERVRAIMNQSKRNTFTYPVGEAEVSMTFVDPEFRLRTFEAFYERLLKIRDAKTIQVVCALFDYAAASGAWQLREVNINDLMKTILKPPKSGYFSQPDRRSFSDVLYFLSELKITLDTEIKDGRKKRVVTYFYRVFDLNVAVYSKKRDGEIDRSVILRFNGELLPGFNKGVNPARLYGKGLLHYDANKDRNAVLLSFLVQTRLSQINQNITDGEALKPCRIVRGELVRFCDYGEEKHNRRRVNDLLKKTLDKLVETGDISSYHPSTLPLDDGAPIHFFPVQKNVKG